MASMNIHRDISKNVIKYSLLLGSVTSELWIVLNSVFEEFRPVIVYFIPFNFFAKIRMNNIKK